VWRAGAYHGSRAVALGLADRIGTIHDAYADLQLSIQMKNEINTPQVDNQPLEKRAGYLRVENLDHFKNMEQKEFETKTSVGSQAEAAPDVQSAITQLSADIKSLAGSTTSLAALEAKVEALTKELANVKEYGEAVNQRYIALEASRGTPVGVKTDNRTEVDKIAEVRQRVKESVTAKL